VKVLDPFAVRFPDWTLADLGLLARVAGVAGEGPRSERRQPVLEAEDGRHN
jgi:hypothetical protein